LPGRDGYEICRRLKREPATRLTPVVLVTGLAERHERLTGDLDSAASIIMTLAVMIEARDGLTEGHSHRMANYATALGRRLGLSEDDLQALHRGGFRTG
jgi:putative two-component system response regulator